MTNRLPPEERKKRIREAVIIVLSVILIIFLTKAEISLTQLSSDTKLGSNIAIFAVINVVILLVILLVYLVSRNVVKLFVESRSNPLAKRLRTKLVLSFVGLSLVPTMLLFFAAAGFINNTVHNWFNTQVETSLSESLEVAQTYYKNSASNALYYGKQISGFIKDQKLLNEDNLPELKNLIRQKQKEYNLGVVEVYSAQREELVRAANPSVPKGEFTNPTSEDINRGLTGEELTRINQAGKADLIRGIVPIRSTWNKDDVVGVVVVNYYVPYSLVSKMKEITESYHEFRQLKILKNPIRTGYIITLFLITTVIVFFAYWMGVYLANSMTRPIQELAEATLKVADGNLDVRIEAHSDDEIGMLVRSFNRMTEDLRTKQQALNISNLELSRINQEIERRRQYMEIVLRNVAAGVISVDREGVVRTINKSAERLLNVKLDSVLGQNFRNVVQGKHLEIVNESLRDLVKSQHDSISRQIFLDVRGTRLALHLHLTMLRDEGGENLGMVVVLDDLTQMMRAQRMAAWREVARRIAHEIKNPLTPIQLSAQRLRKRYLSRFSDDEKVFDECTEMIIKSVDDLKNLVNEFSNFARMPAIQPEPNDINALIRETLTLYQEAHRGVTFAFVEDELMPKLTIDRDQIKRVIINVLENAVAAMEESGNIVLTTTYDAVLKMAVISIADDGPGVPAEDKQRLFEPYFSTKKSGTGLGLAIVSSVINDHGGFVRVRDNKPHGAVFVIELPAG
ncbi:MAG: PAS domain-containing sensor histidine kinase [Geobacteraceae bacterium GWC2_55_20]|nr:MAG: PAS domain-containing sensor histidine kinase [Geobacteraceae bacterium GWC2_55_20]OGU19406.1 MAG: PAS domain-containing sensor histidine kinase [Geobacteraceae bacterium GWF2_54_21]HBA71920.1 PAS domain-containing sensor histidine kinase [Geobacter sp.]HCE66669.1 PAS domain-containing sensor histidine kinase [Geobacter sp.]